MNILQKYGNGMKIHDLDKEDKILMQWIEGFVDDTSNFTNLDYEDTNLQLLRTKLEQDGKLWSGLLESSGGRLEMNKCFYYLLEWNWDAKGNPYPMINSQTDEYNIGISINTQTSNGQKILLEQKDVRSSHKTLGVYKNLCGNNQKQFTYLLDKSSNMVERIANSSLTRSQARRAYSTSFLPAILYSLVAVNLIKKQLKKIQQVSISPFIRKCGYEKCFPRCVVDAPTMYGGLGFYKIFTEQFGRKIETLISHVNDDSEVGQLVMSDLNLYQITLGTTKPILEGIKPPKYTDNNWLGDIGCYIYKFIGSIQIDKLWKPTLLRINDRVIMDIVDDLDVTDAEKRIFNNFRIYLRVTTVSQIVDTFGEYILPELMDKDRCTTFNRKRTEKWPNQQSPDKKYFSTWKKIILIATNSNKFGKLSKPLGTWDTNVIHKHNHQYLLNHDEDRLAIKNTITNKWTKHKYHHVQYSNYYFNLQESEYVRTIDYKDYKPVDVEYQEDYILIRTRFMTKANPLNINRIHKNDETKWIHNTIVGDDLELNNTIYNTQNNKLIIYSDGGLINNIGSYGVVVSNEDNIMIKMGGKVDTIYGELTSYRTEGIGILQAMKITNHMIKQRQLNDKWNQTEIKFLCDNKSMIDMINKIKYNIPTLKQYYTNESDILIEIIHQFKEMKKHTNNIQFKHIKGHQDQIKRRNELTNEEILNVEADLLFTGYTTFIRPKFT
jgi:ribonuclease HI